jgi:hypothetical protein
MTGACTHWKTPPFHGAHPERTLSEGDQYRPHNPYGVSLLDQIDSSLAIELPFGESSSADPCLYFTAASAAESSALTRFDHAFVFSTMSATRRNAPGRSAKKLS